MKKIAILILASLFFIVGCQDEDSFLSPQKEAEVINLDKLTLKKDGGVEDYSHLLYDLGDVYDYQIKASKKFIIDGSKGGKIELKISWKNENKKRVELEAKLDIPKYAFEGEKDFDMIFNLKDYNLELYPSPCTFDIPLDLDLKFKNVDLSQYIDSGLDFNYIDNLGERMVFKNCKIDFKASSLEVEKAELHHFSRYGWTRLK